MERLCTQVQRSSAVFASFSRLLVAVGDWVNPPFNSTISKFFIYSRLFLTLILFTEFHFFSTIFFTKFFALFMKFYQKTQIENFNETLLYVTFFSLPVAAILFHHVAFFQMWLENFFFFFVCFYECKTFLQAKVFLARQKKKRCDNNKRLLTD